MNKDIKESGFTLIEVIAIIIILGIIIAVVAGVIVGGQNTQQISETEIIKSHLRYAEQLSINGDDTYRWGIQIGAGTASYSLGSLQNPYTVIATNVILPGGNGPTHTFASGVTLAGVSAADIISFDQWGAPYVNNVLLPANLVITVTQNGVSTGFTITKNTGFIP